MIMQQEVELKYNLDLFGCWFCFLSDRNRNTFEKVLEN